MRDVYNRVRRRVAFGATRGPGISVHVSGKIETLALEAYVKGHTVYLMRAL